MLAVLAVLVKQVLPVVNPTLKLGLKNILVHIVGTGLLPVEIRNNV